MQWIFKTALILTVLSGLWFLYDVFLEAPPRFFRVLLLSGAVLLLSGCQMGYVFQQGFRQLDLTSSMVILNHPNAQQGTLEVPCFLCFNHFHNRFQ